MKYFTKEFYEMEWLSYANQNVKKSKRAERKDEEFYRKTYERACAIYVFNEKMNDWFRDPVEEMRKIDEYVNEPDISKEERCRRIAFRSVHVSINRERIEKNKVYEFDEELCERQFEEIINRMIELYRKLPQEIVEKIADIRLFALGYASAEVKRLLRPYCAELRRNVRKIREKAFAETDEAEGYLSEKIGFNEYKDCLITGIEENNGSIRLNGEGESYLTIQDGEIIEGNGKTVYDYDGEAPNCPWSRVMATELHRVNEKFELHFLVENRDAVERVELWYLTIRGTNIEAF